MTLTYRTVQTTAAEYPLRPRAYMPASVENLSFSAMLFDDAWPLLRCYEATAWRTDTPRVPQIVVAQRPAHPDCPTNGPEACAVCRVFYQNVEALGLRGDTA